MSNPISPLLTRAHAKGNDAAFRAWTQRQASCISGGFSEYLESGEGRCIAAHVRRAGESGTGYKSPYAVIPLTNYEHLQQHNHGELALLERYVPRIGGWTVEDGKAWYDAKRVEYLELWLAS